MFAAVIVHEHTVRGIDEPSEERDIVGVVIPTRRETDVEFQTRVDRTVEDMRSRIISGFGITRPEFDGVLVVEIVEVIA